MTDVTGKVAIITGGAGGIGSALAKELLRNNAKGVCLADLCETKGHQVLEDLKQFGEGKAIFVKTDITDQKQLKEVFEKTIQTYNQLDILVNNAGILSENEECQKTIDINLTATIRASFLAIKEYFPKYKSGNEGLVVFISSIAALEPAAISTVYGASKAGMLAFGQALSSKSWQDKYHFRILSICPGTIKTDILDNFLDKILFPEQFDEQSIRDVNLIMEAEDFAKKSLEAMSKASNGEIWFINGVEGAYRVSYPLRRQELRQD